MTAFGRGHSEVEGGGWSVEIRTVNSRYLDYHLRNPPALGGIEERIKKLVATRLTRGRISIFIRAQGAAEPSPKLMLNRPLVAEYRRVLDELSQELGLTGDPGLGPFLTNRDLIKAEEADPDLDRLWDELSPALEAALDSVVRMRVVEGEALTQDLSERLARLAGLFEQVAARAPEIVDGYRRRLGERITQILEHPEPDPQRLAYEVAIMADKCDITEEAVRAASHLAQFKGLLAKDKPVGRKLDFLVQELNREANTMGSKCPDAEAAQQVVEIKAELERVREQVQNLE